MACRESRAFTLLELVITLSVIAILATMGIPTFQKFTQKQAISAAINTLHSDLLLARSRAVYEDAEVVACPGNIRSGCSGSTNWGEGWIVFADTNADRAWQSDEILIRNSMAVEQMSIFGSAGRTSIRFLPNGSAPGSNSSISFCGPGGPSLARKLVISNLGRVRRDSATNLDPAKCP
jgi:type IV fimbrial biogenesis protein FimT